MTDTSGIREEMTRVAGALYALGALLLALATWLPTWPDANRWLLTAYAVTAALSAVVLELSARYRPMNVPELMVVAVLGIVIITLVVLAGGPEASASLAVFHVFVLAYGFFYFPRWWAWTEVSLIGASYAVALWHLGSSGPASRWVLVVGAYAAVGAIFGTIGSRIRESLEREVRSVAKLREVDTLKTTFLRAVSHELRTPLTNVVGYTTTLKTHRHRLDDERIDEILDRTVANARKLEQLLVDLLDLDRVARGIVRPKLAPTDIGAVVRNVCDHLDFGDHPISVEADPVTITADASKVERIVENLLANAIKHTSSETPIWVRVREEPADATGTGGSGSAALIVVEDAGPGVPDDLKQALFEPFRQGPDAADSPTPGTGIGLSLVLQFTSMHTGQVWVEDRPGGGSRFCVRLPAVPEGAMEADFVDQAPDPTPLAVTDR